MKGIVCQDGSGEFADFHVGEPHFGDIFQAKKSQGVSRSTLLAGFAIPPIMRIHLRYARTGAGAIVGSTFRWNNFSRDEFAHAAFPHRSSGTQINTASLRWCAVCRQNGRFAGHAASSSSSPSSSPSSSSSSSLSGGASGSMIRRMARCQGISGCRSSNVATHRCKSFGTLKSSSSIFAMRSLRLATICKIRTLQ